VIVRAARSLPKFNASRNWRVHADLRRAASTAFLRSAARHVDCVYGTEALPAALFARPRPAGIAPGFSPNPFPTFKEIVMSRQILLTAAALCVSCVALADELNERADRKITGEYYRPHTASSYHRSAYYNAQTLNYYGRRYRQVPTETAKEHAAEIRRNLTAAQKETAKLKHEAKANTQIDDRLKAIEAHQAKALGLVAKMEKAEADGKKLAEYAALVSKELQAAEVENDKLKKLLGIESLESAATHESK
jgi:hypothetical protein